MARIEQKIAKQAEAMLQSVRASAKEVSLWSLDVRATADQLKSRDGCDNPWWKDLSNSKCFSPEEWKMGTLSSLSYPVKLFSDLTGWAAFKLLGKSGKR